MTDHDGKTISCNRTTNGRKGKTMKANTTNTKATATADERKATFSALLATYADESKDTTTKAYETALTDLATAVAYSVLKKCIDTGYNETLVSIRHELAKDKSTLTALAHCSEHATRLTYNDNGDLVSETIDNDCKKALSKLASVGLGDGLDLVNTAIVAILEETAKQTASGEAVDLERPYTVRRLKKKVWIKSADSVNGWETVETTPIREIYKAVRRAIDASRAAATDPRNGYSYLEELATDPESGEETTIYRRLTKYADLGGYATDYNGACTLYSVDGETVADSETLVSALNLTKRQAQALKLRESGYGYKAIATYLGIRPDSVRDIFKAIQKKVKSCDKFDSALVERYASAK